MPGTLTNSEEPGEMPHNAAFHQNLHCLIMSKQSSRMEIHHNWEMQTSQPFTHISLTSFLWDIGKQYKTRSEATKRD